jgi:hypothetical protein
MPQIEFLYCRLERHTTALRSDESEVEQICQFVLRRLSVLGVRQLRGLFDELATEQVRICE